ncbi:hypothetical protein Acsp02_97070 [Actinoplanes sp. NBRC 103695]|nr:hypothetical protein Acsp02_97070 [Actinoplanes sp. NBRC 103695]
MAVARIHPLALIVAVLGTAAATSGNNATPQPESRTTDLAGGSVVEVLTALLRRHGLFEVRGAGGCGGGGGKGIRHGVLAFAGWTGTGCRCESVGDEAKPPGPWLLPL